MEEVEKYTKLWDLPQGYGNNWDHPYWQEIALFVRKAMDERGLEANDSVLDIGGGRGALRKVIFKGCDYTTLDIAPNSGADIVADISKAHEFGYMTEHGMAHPIYDWAVAIDMLEHLPTPCIPDALFNIKQLARNGAVFLISTRADRGGKKIGTTLHMTVREPKWWVHELSEVWDTAELLRTVAGEYCIVSVT